jgi:hypothetical protein
MGWADEEMKVLEIGDKRLNERVKYTLEKLGESYNSSFPACFKTRSELVAAYRLFNNKFVTPEKVMRGHYESTIERAKEYPVVLLINDTSSLDYTSKDIEGIGRLEKDYTKGFFIHPLLAVTPGRLPLGVIDNYNWIRGDERRREISGNKRANEPIEEKESIRWLKSYKNASVFAQSCPNTKCVYVADRESDILELLTEGINAKQEGVNLDFLIRAKHDRVLLGEQEDNKLKKALKNAPLIAEISFEIPGRGFQKSRKVNQKIRAKEIIINGKVVREKEYPPIRLNAVLCIEEEPPAGAEPVVWFLLTTLPIQEEKGVLEIIKYYLCRWEIETFFHVLKNGCNIEGRGLKMIGGIKLALAIFIIVSWRVMFLLNISRQNPNRPCNEIFEDVEWMSVCKILTKKVPRTPQV